MLKKRLIEIDQKLDQLTVVTGRTFFVMNTTDIGYNEFVGNHDNYLDGQKAVFNTFAAGEDAMVSNRNDMLLFAGHGSHSGAMVTTAKSRCYFIGMNTGGRINSQHTKITTPATSVAASIAVVNNTGTRNTFKNIKFIQNGTNSAQTSAFIDTGEGTFVKHCSIHHNSLLSTADTQALLFKGDTCQYEDTEIGNSTVYHTATNQAPLVIKTPARYSYFIRCSIIQYSSQTTASCVDVPDANGIIGWVMFKGCTFMSANKGDGSTAGGTMAEGITSVCTSGYIYIDNKCSFFQCAKACEADGSIFNAAGAAVAVARGGEAIKGA